MSPQRKQKDKSERRSKPVKTAAFSRSFIMPALLATSVIMLVTTAVGYHFIVQAIPQTTEAQEREVAVARIASRLEGELHMIRKIIVQQSEHQALRDYFHHLQNEQAVLADLNRKIPYLIGIRLLAKGPLAKDDTASPPIGYAASELVNRTEQDRIPSDFELHFFGNEHEHIVMDAPVLENGELLGHLYVMLSSELLRDLFTRQSALPSNSYLELSQFVNEQLKTVLATQGAEELKNTEPNLLQYIEDSRFALSLWGPTSNPWQIQLSIETIVFFALQAGTLLLLLLLIGILLVRVNAGIKHDLANLMNMFEQLQRASLSQHFHFRLAFFQGAADALREKYVRVPVVKPKTVTADNRTSPPMAETPETRSAAKRSDLSSAPEALKAPKIPLPPPLSAEPQESTHRNDEAFDLGESEAIKNTPLEEDHAAEPEKNEWILDFPQGGLDNDELAALEEPQDEQATTDNLLDLDLGSESPTMFEQTDTALELDSEKLTADELENIRISAPNEDSDQDLKQLDIALNLPENELQIPSDLRQDPQALNQKESDPSLDAPMIFDLADNDEPLELGATQTHDLASSLQPHLEIESFTASTDEQNSTPLSVPKSIFRTYDIRGIVATDLTPEVVYQIGLAFGTEAQSQAQDTVIIGRDGRLSSPDLAEQLSRGLMASGCDVIDIGLCPTPILYYATHLLDSDTGIMITGSHNPKDYNGLKMVMNGQTLSGEQVMALRTRIEAQDFTSGKGQISYNDEILPNYLKRIATDVELPRTLKVVVDSGNGATSNIAPILFRTLGCQVTELYCEIDGEFPNHHPDPSQPDNLQDLIRTVKDQAADIGLAFDGDGDRLGIVTAQGDIIWPDRQMMLFAMDVLSRNPGATIIYDVKCSKHLARIIEEHEGIAIMWKTGHSLIKNKLRETGALLAGEMSGHIFFKERWYGFDDALYSAARLLEILARDPRAIQDIFDALPDSVNTPELRIDMKEGQNYSFMDLLMHEAEFADSERITIDGLRVEFNDGWGLIRASNTTPSVVLRFEADNQSSLARIQKLFREQILKIDASLTLPF